MTMSVPETMRASVTNAATPGPTETDASAFVLLPPPADSLDGLAALYLIFAENNHLESKAAMTEIAAKQEARRAAREAQEAALAEAEKAQQEQGGFFDAMGIGSLVGIATANPLLVMADVSMHMSRLTPDLLRDFEKDNAESIELATKLYCVTMNAAALEDGLVTPEAMRAAIAIGGLLVQETEVLGKDASAWVGTGMTLGCSVDRGAAAMALIADKDSAVADEIREVDRESLKYTKWIAIAGMAVAAGAAIVGSAGTATAPVVLIGVALSAGGFAIQETKCLDPLIGKNASMWIGGGMMLGGAVLTGVGAAGAAPKALAMVGTAVEGAVQVHGGMHRVESAAVRHEVDEAHIIAQKHMNNAQRLMRQVDLIIDELRENAQTYRRIAAAVQEVTETESETRLMSMGVRA
ncbi:MAG: hypothetical protein KIT84_17840 [Labilithrix sp.]|nr:hypothetical protein [Labilithrix sp.]MCW5812896.1 hypothetical protein [Labilithrix sp.]